MSPHRVDYLPSRAALSQYGISKNGFLPEEAPLERLPQTCYQPWERIIEELPKLIEQQQIRAKVDALPVLDTAQLSSEAEWQRACSILALIAQGYIWTGPEPSQVGFIEFGDLFVADYCCSDCRPPLPFPSFRRPNISKCRQLQHTQH